MTYRKVIFMFVCVATTTTLAKIPSYIHVCKRNDPQFDQCVRNSVEALREKLKTGIPELDVPPLEPLKLGDLVVQHGGRMMKFFGTDFEVLGASHFEIDELKSDKKHLNFQVKLRFPSMVIKSVFEVVGKLLSLNLHGKGPVDVKADDISGNGIIKARKVQRDGKTYFALDSLDLKMNLKNYEVRLSKGFFKDQSITDAVNIAVHENKRDVINLIKPRVEQVVKDVLLDIGNKITKHFTYDELFPEN